MTRSRLTSCLFLLVFCSAIPAQQLATNQPSPTVSQAGPVRDPQAVATLGQALGVAGGTSALSAIQDYTATGQITYFWAGKEVTGSVTLRGRIPDQFRLDANLPEGTHSWYVSHGNGASKDPDGKTTPIPSWTALSAGILGLPISRLNRAVADTATSIVPEGQAQIGSTSAVRVRVQKSFSKQQDPTGNLSKWSAKDFLIDPQSLQVVGVRDSLRANKSSTQEIEHQFLYSNYRQVNGISAPFTITETVGGQMTWRIDLQSMSFNSGLANDVFHF